MPTHKATSNVPFGEVEVLINLFILQGKAHKERRTSYINMFNLLRLKNRPFYAPLLVAKKIQQGLNPIVFLSDLTSTQDGDC